MSSWGFIILSFILLFLGGAVSFFFKEKKLLQIEAEEMTMSRE
jgi:hypothetical protein